MMKRVEIYVAFPTYNRITRNIWYAFHFNLVSTRIGILLDKSYYPNARSIKRMSM